MQFFAWPFSLLLRVIAHVVNSQHDPSLKPFLLVAGAGLLMWGTFATCLQLTITYLNA